MNEGLMYRDRLLSELSDSIFTAVSFFMKVDENLFDGHQTAREVLSHLVFWHHEYGSISRAFLQNQRPTLLEGSLALLNAQATCEYQEQDMAGLAQLLAEEQKVLDSNLRDLPDWNVNFPIKKGCRRTDVAGRICSIVDHIHHHMVRQERAHHRGEAWIKAYYLDSTP